MFDTENLGALFDSALGGDRPALIDCRDWSAPRQYSHAEVDRESDAVARGLLARGLKPGDAVAILAANRAEFMFAYMGCLRAGLVAVPVNYKFSPEIIQFILSDAEVKLIIADAPRRAELDTDIPIVDFDAAGPKGYPALRDPGAFKSYRPEADHLAMVLYTSGSTGRPKGVPLTHKGHIWALKGRIGGWPYRDHRLLIAAPLYHMNALCSCLFGFAVAASTVILPEFDARRYLKAIARFQCTWITSVPTMLAMALLEKDLLAELELSSVRVVRMGSAPISRKLWDTVAKQFPGANIMNGYGTTEAGPIVFGAAGGKAVPPLSVGRQMPEVDLKLIDDAGAEADQGVLWHRTPATMTGYFNLPEKTREVLTRDGWYISGDVFRRDDEGCYYFVGRDDDMFNCGGENIYPGDVESILVSHENVAEACVVPVPDDIKGHKPVAFVVPTAGTTVDEETVKQHALANGPAYQHPRMVVVLEALPLAGPGKIDRNALAARARELWRNNFD